MQRVPVYLTARIVDSSARLIGNDVDLLTQEVAERVRALLGARGDTLPKGEPRITWQSIHDHLHITAFRERPARLDTSVAPEESASSSDEVQKPHHRFSRDGIRLLAEAFEAVRNHSEPFFLWPETVKADSLRFAIHFTRIHLDGKGKEMRDSTKKPRARFLAFSLAVPREQQAIPARLHKPEYPPEARRLGFQGEVLMQFVIDTTGQARPGTLKNLLAEKVRLADNNDRCLYDLLEKEVRQSVMRSKYSPARIGGCAVSVLVQQPYSFSIGMYPSRQ
jgi:hypothetical protein